MVSFVEVRTERFFLFIYYGILFSVMVVSVIQNIENPWNTLVFAGLFLLSFALRNTSLFLLSDGLPAKMMVIVEFILISFATFFDSGHSSSIYFYVLIANITLVCSPFFSGIFTGISFITISVLRLYKESSHQFSGFFLVFVNHLIILGVLFLLMFLIRKEIVQGKQLKEALFQLKIKTKQSEDMYVKLKETTARLEEMTTVKERNRIAREIHDTVGHTLTTVLIEIEAGRRLMRHNQEEASVKLSQAGEQVRKGLNRIRESVRLLKEGGELKALTHSMTLLIAETIKHGGVYINYEMDPMPALSQTMEEFLYRALSEGLSNGIKHGGSTAFLFKLKKQSNQVCFFLQDNGKGTDHILFGFGLASMKESAEELGGTFSVQTSFEEGFTLQIELPIDKEEGE